MSSESDKRYLSPFSAKVELTNYKFAPFPPPLTSVLGLE